MSGHWKTAGATALLLGLVLAGSASAAPGTDVSAGTSAATSTSPPAQAAVCGAPAAGHASCHAVKLLYPARDWHPGPEGPDAGTSAASLPSSGYLPGDLLSAYGLASAAGAFQPGSNAPTVAIVDAFDDPNALSDLIAYRTNLSGATDPNTGKVGPALPPVCPASTPCVTVQKLFPAGGTPQGNTGWGTEISLDLDMISAVCPNCNIDLVEAATNSFSDLAGAVSYAKALPGVVAVTNSYGGSEFSTETGYNGTYAAVTGQAVTVATGDNGYGVEFPASAPATTAVGGTSLTYVGSGNSLVWNAQSVWSGAGSGCSAYESLPSWQNDPNVYDVSSTCGHREVADVSAVADPSTGVAVYDTYSEPGWTVFGGTSASAQIVGAVYAVAAGGGSMHSAPSSLYPDTAANGLTGSTPGLVPVQSGSNSRRCSIYLCNAGHSLSSGYNGPTGLGTPSGIGAFTGAAPGPDFGLSASPGSRTATQGSGTSYGVTVSPSGGFGGQVSLSLSSPPAGVTYGFSPNPATTSSSLSISTAANTPAGSYPLTITGTSGALTHTTGVTLVVQSSSSSTMTVQLTAGGIKQKGPNFQVPLTVTAADSTSGVGLSGASVTLSIYSGACPASGSPSTTTSGTTGSTGQYSATFSNRTATTWCAVATVNYAGYSTGTGSLQFST